MYDWVRALLDPTDIVQSPSSAKKQITPPPKFELPLDEPTPSSHRSRSRRSASPSKKSTSPRKRTGRATKDVLATPSTTAANNSLQENLELSLGSEASATVLPTVEETEVKPGGSLEKKSKGRKSKKTAAETEEETAEKKEEKKTERRTKKDLKEKETQKETEVEVTAAANAIDNAQSTQAAILSEIPSAAETQEMIAKAKEMVEDAIQTQQTDGAGPQASKKRKPVEEDDEETAAEAAQRTKKARVLEDKLKRERVRNRALFGVSAAFALA